MRSFMLLLAIAACGGTGSANNNVTISAAGVSPGSIQIASGATVTFINNDTAPHQIASTACTELASGSIAAGASATVTLGTGPKTCAYDDALNPTKAAFSGSVTVAAPGQAGY